MARHLDSIALLTFGMGVAVTISWLAFAARIQVYDFAPTTIFTVSRLAVYGSQLLLVATLMYVVARRRLRCVSFGTTIGIVTAAWVGEGLVLTIIGEPLVANELDPSTAWWYWLVATAGPLQPMAGIIGGWLGIRLRR